MKYVRNVRTCAAILSVFVLVVVAGWFILRNSKTRHPQPPAPKPVAELISASGMVLVQSPRKAEWREVKTGASFSDGDLVRTDSAGTAGIRYNDGATVSIPENTVFRIRTASDNQMEISAPPDAALLPLLVAGENGIGSKEGPFIELQQIIPFGRSLELIGRVEAGSRLTINGESVEVNGDGLFKHFTRPFPAWADMVRLNLKVSDLAGRTRVYTATHDFRSHGEGN